MQEAAAPSPAGQQDSVCVSLSAANVDSIASISNNMQPSVPTASRRPRARALHDDENPLTELEGAGCYAARHELCFVEG
jgi:hypothetical protein